MAAPTYISGADLGGVTDSGGAWGVSIANTAVGGVQIGDLIIAQVFQDGSTAGAVAATTFTKVENLAGTDNAMDYIGAFNVGSPVAGIQHLWIGRSLANTLDSFPAITAGTNSTSEDLYMRGYTFRNCSLGTTLATVIENSTAGTATGAAGTSTTVADVAVTTLGRDRLALNFVALNDDAMGLAAFAGESGGDWTLPVAIYETSTGTDGTIALMNASMPTAGTIDGGSDAITSCAWGVVGFALIGTTSEFVPQIQILMDGA